MGGLAGNIAQHVRGSRGSGIPCDAIGQRRLESVDWRLIGGGHGIHWEALDEDLSVEGLLAGIPSGESEASLARWLKEREQRGVPTYFVGGTAQWGRGGTRSYGRSVRRHSPSCQLISQAGQ
ncbi:MAG: DUF2442 domain-containing protein [Gammaproteobacteria bacterium]|nr:DUF2442 domain-containing protein [Gammaproteobacteria bacterium]